MNEDRAALRARLIGESVGVEDLDDMRERYVDWLLDRATSADRHRVMMGWNWDDGMTIPTWIIRHPECDKATLLVAFWNAQPEYDLRYEGERDAVPSFERERFDFAVEARRRFLSGAYGGAAIAFSLDDPCTWPRDFAQIEAEFGAVAKEQLPDAMREPVTGVHLSCDDIIEGIPAEFWPERLR